MHYNSLPQNSVYELWLKHFHIQIGNMVSSVSQTMTYTDTAGFPNESSLSPMPLRSNYNMYRIQMWHRRDSWLIS